MDKNIRVDQSHCNFQLSKQLTNMGWDVLFRDPGRVSRGLSGNQEKLLGIFERNGWPIPDIAALKAGSLLLIEVDKSIRSNIHSLVTYREKTTAIVGEILQAGFLCKVVLLGFCKVGIASPGDKTAAASIKCDVLVDFPEPMSPRFHWSD